MGIETHGSVSCGSRNLRGATGKCVFYRSKENIVFMHLYSLTLPKQKHTNFSV